ncbi:MAG: pseudouridine synthase [Sulfurovum sp.]|nr:pseudouridine synthase [Sulfurovum sp.]
MNNAEGLIQLKMQTSLDGKVSSTLIHPLSYDNINNQTLVEAIPYTGRQHQIRVHLEAISHRIVGDPIYGLDEGFVDAFLKGNIDKSERIEITGHLG